MHFRRLWGAPGTGSRSDLQVGAGRGARRRGAAARLLGPCASRTWTRKAAWSIPRGGPGRAWTAVAGESAPVAAIDHRELDEDERRHLDAVVAAAKLALENERLDAELRARLKDLEASRARIVEAGYAERKRVERDLHDGAQQRLVGLALNLRLAKSMQESDPEGAAAILDEASEELTQATEELRELARGSIPPSSRPADCPPRSRHSRPGAPSGRGGDRGRGGCPSQWRPPPTSSRPRLSRTLPVTPGPRRRR